jgi:hypothetical protein
LDVDEDGSDSPPEASPAKRPSRQLLSIDPLFAKSQHGTKDGEGSSDSSLGSKGLDDLLKRAKKKKTNATATAGDSLTGGHADDVSEMSNSDKLLSSASFHKSLKW